MNTESRPGPRAASAKGHIHTATSPHPTGPDALHRSARHCARTLKRMSWNKRISDAKQLPGRQGPTALTVLLEHSTSLHRHAHFWYPSSRPPHAAPRPARWDVPPAAARRKHSLRSRLTVSRHTASGWPVTRRTAQRSARNRPDQDDHLQHKRTETGACSQTSWLPARPAAHRGERTHPATPLARAGRSTSADDRGPPARPEATSAQHRLKRPRLHMISPPPPVPRDSGHRRPESAAGTATPRPPQNTKEAFSTGV